MATLPVALTECFTTCSLVSSYYRSHPLQLMLSFLLCALCQSGLCLSRQSTVLEIFHVLTIAASASLQVILLMSSILSCPCGRSFFQVSAFGNHQRSCARTKKRLVGALGKSKEIFAQKKRKIIHNASASTLTIEVPIVQIPGEIEACTISALGWVLD